MSLAEWVEWIEQKQNDGYAAGQAAAEQAVLSPQFARNPEAYGHDDPKLLHNTDWREAFNTGLHDRMGERFRLAGWTSAVPPRSH